jgi:TRAP-type C4-dicarboxylate transport system permease small subunit
MKKLNKIVDILENISTIIFSLLFALIILQIGYRYFHLSLPWTEEMARISLIWSVFLGSAVALIKRDHIRVDIVDRHLSVQGKKIYDLVTDFLILLFSIVWCIGAFEVFVRNQNISLVTLDFSVGNSFYLPTLISSGLIIIVLVLRIFQGFFTYKKGAT